jgi:hypothetical protein
VTAAAEFFAALPDGLGEVDEALAGAVVAFALDGAPAGGWTLRLAEGGASVEAGVGAADVTVACSCDDWERLLAHSLSPQTAWATGRLAVRGDMRMAQRLRALLEL